MSELSRDGAEFGPDAGNVDAMFYCIIQKIRNGLQCDYAAIPRSTDTQGATIERGSFARLVLIES
ncbi:hypothetical protein [Ensifer sp.]|jgi:hypothetical protein|uniref:hypothetical protein n=1 Tax=Ensifer sp. TaxID=1872086 RepID=UPI002E152374|nr:hypothetical protein [Ensifer sp.]